MIPGLGNSDHVAVSGMGARATYSVSPTENLYSWRELSSLFTKANIVLRNPRPVAALKEP